MEAIEKQITELERLWRQTKEFYPESKEAIEAALETLKRSRWIPVEEGGEFPADNEEINCWNGERVVASIYRCDDREPNGYAFEVQKNPSNGDRSIVTYWTGITHWQPLPEPPDKS